MYVCTQAPFDFDLNLNSYYSIQIYATACQKILLYSCANVILTEYCHKYKTSVYLCQKIYLLWCINASLFTIITDALSMQMVKICTQKIFPVWFTMTWGHNQSKYPVAVKLTQISTAKNDTT